MDRHIEFRLDPDAEPGDIVKELAALLLDMTRMNKEKAGEKMKAESKSERIA